MLNCFFVAAADNVIAPYITAGTAPAIQSAELEELLTKEVYAKSSVIPAYSAPWALPSSSCLLPLLFPFPTSFAYVSVPEVARPPSSPDLLTTPGSPLLLPFDFFLWLLNTKDSSGKHEGGLFVWGVGVHAYAGG